MMNSLKEHLCHIAHLTYTRFLTDSAGGNMSIRDGDRIYCTPKYAGTYSQWKLRPEQIVVTDMEGEQLAGEGELSREYAMHLRIYQTLPEVGGIVHAHPPYSLIFAHLELPIPPALEQTDIIGVTGLCEKHPSHSPDLARTVAETLAKRREEIADHPVACILPRHGVTVAGTDVDYAFDVLERIEGSARIWAHRQAVLSQFS